jgi:rhodanese-related sulfurtransferase
MECHKAARRAAEFGYKDLYIMPAGIVGWTKAGKPVVKGDKPNS